MFIKVTQIPLQAIHSIYRKSFGQAVGIILGTLFGVFMSG